MTDLNDFIGASGRSGQELSYIVDGVPMPDSFGKFTYVSPNFAVLHGGAFKIGTTYLAQGSLSLVIDPVGDKGVIVVVFDIGDEDDATAHQPWRDQADITYRVLDGGQVLQISGEYTALGPFVGTVRQVDDGQNTELSAAFNNFFGGKPVTAKLVPKT